MHTPAGPSGRVGPARREGSRPPDAPRTAPRDGPKATEGWIDRRSLGRAGFETGSDVYERARPGYHAAVMSYIAEVLELDQRSRVLDLAAGTGKMTRQLQVLCPRCLAVEPSPSMRAVFAEAVPGGIMAAGAAESIPVATGTMDAVVVAQAFHWFDTPEAVTEIARTLRPGGGLALVWNERDERDPLVAELVRVSKWDACQPYPVGKDFSEGLDDSGLFGPVLRRTFPFVQYVDRESFVDQVASRSYVQVLPEPERATLLGRVAELADGQDEPIAIPYVADVFTARCWAGSASSST